MSSRPDGLMHCTAPVDSAITCEDDVRCGRLSTMPRDERDDLFLEGLREVLELAGWVVSFGPLFRQPERLVAGGAQRSTDRCSRPRYTGIRRPVVSRSISMPSLRAFLAFLRAVCLNRSLHTVSKPPSRSRTCECRGSVSVWSPRATAHASPRSGFGRMRSPR
jgi:hypothetical protein